MVKKRPEPEIYFSESGRPILILLSSLAQQS